MGHVISSSNSANTFATVCAPSLRLDLGDTAGLERSDLAHIDGGTRRFLQGEELEFSRGLLGGGVKYAIESGLCPG